MEPLIFLVHRIPYPPNKGDKIRSYHILRFLAAHYRVHLGAFVDHPEDWRHAETLQAHCASLHLEPLPRLRGAARALGGLVRGQPLTVPYYASSRMRRWVQGIVGRTGARRLLAFSAAMAQYAGVLPGQSLRVLDLVDVDSDKWRQYGEQHHGVAGWLYRREAARLLAYERRAAAAFDATTLVSAAEVQLFRTLCPEAGRRVHEVANGVDAAYFSPEREHPDPYPSGAVPLVFTGAMDYWPNVDAVNWFASEILPEVRRRIPNASFHIVGARPTDAVRALASIEGVCVVGAVPDMRPWLQHAALAVAPLRVARGIQNKVLEAFSMARPVVATSAALDGLELSGDYPLRADGVDAFAGAVCHACGPEADPGLGARMRARVTAGHAWESRLERLRELLEGATEILPVAAPESLDLQRISA